MRLVARLAVFLQLDFAVRPKHLPAAAVPGEDHEAVRPVAFDPLAAPQPFRKRLAVALPLRKLGETRPVRGTLKDEQHIVVVLVGGRLGVRNLALAAMTGYTAHH